MQNPMQQPSESIRSGPQRSEVVNENPLALQGHPTKQGVFKSRSIPPAGVELSRDAMAISGDSAKSAAPALHSGGFDPALNRLIELWPMLAPDDRAALLARAEHLAVIRDDATGETSSR